MSLVDAGPRELLFARFKSLMALPHTLKFGSKFLLDTVARPVIRGDTGIAITLTEPEGGSDLANLHTTAIKSPDGSHYVVNGQKKFITGGMLVGWFSTLVRTGGPGIGGLSLLAIDATLPGITVRKLRAQGWWSGNTTSVSFDDVKVPCEYLIGSENAGFLMMAAVMNGERIIACQGAIRCARTCLSEAIKWARSRKTFGNVMSKHQVIRHKIAQMALRVEAAQATLDALAYSMNAGAKPEEIGGPTALAKVQATSAYEYCCREASQIFGGAAFLRQGKGQKLERLVRELRVSVVGGGSEEVMLDLAMRQARL